MLTLIGYWTEKGWVKEFRQEKYEYFKEKFGVLAAQNYLDTCPPIEEKQDPYIHPKQVIDPEFWQKHNKEKISQYLKSGTVAIRYRGFSCCRLCEKMLGSCERTDGIWAWPDMLEHYVDEHDVILPIPFLNHAESNNYKIDIDGFDYNTDLTFWEEWCNRHGTV